MGDAFGVGIRGEDAALGGEFVAGLRSFDDAVMDDGDIPGNMGMGVSLAGSAVGGPAGMGDAGDAGNPADWASSSATAHRAARSMPTGDGRQAGGVSPDGLSFFKPSMRTGTILFRAAAATMPHIVEPQTL